MPVSQKLDMPCRKNAALAADDTAAAETAAPSSDKVVTGEQGFAEDMADLKQKARKVVTSLPCEKLPQA
jgi:hypothetical protein